MKKQSEIEKVGVYMFYYSNESRSRVVHYEGCHHLKNIKEENLRSFDSVKDVLELHHENSFEKEHDNSVPGYHRQNYISDSIIGYMEYITNHEYYRMYNPVPIFTKKEPPMKGTKRWKKQQKAIKRKERKREIWNVINLIDSLSAGACVAHA